MACPHGCDNADYCQQCTNESDAPWLREALERPLFKSGDFTLHSGQHSTWKIDCDVLRDQDWATLAAIAANVLPPFAEVEGVPFGGFALAESLRKYRQPTGSLLIVDDVLTTGNSMEELRAGRDAIGLVVFARGPCPPWVKALWTFTGDKE